MSAYRNKMKREPQIKIGSKIEDVEYSTKNIDPTLNYLNRQIYAEESLKKARQKQQMAEYSYYAKAIGNMTNPYDHFKSKVNFDNYTGKIGQEQKEEDYLKYAQSQSKIHGNYLSMNNRAKDIRGMNYHGYNIINNNILGFCNPEQKFPQSSYQTNFVPKCLEKEVSNMTPSQFEDYKKFREEQLKNMENNNLNNQQMQLNNLNVNQMIQRNDVQQKALRNYETQQYDIQKQEQEKYQQMLKERQMIPQQDDYQKYQQSHIDDNPIPNKNQDNYYNDKNLANDYPAYNNDNNVKDRLPNDYHNSDNYYNQQQYMQSQIENQDNNYNKKELNQNQEIQNNNIDNDSRLYQQYLKERQQMGNSNIKEQTDQDLNNNRIPKEYPEDYYKLNYGEGQQVEGNPQNKEMLQQERHTPYPNTNSNPSNYAPSKNLPNGISDEEYIRYMNYLRQREQEDEQQRKQTEQQNNPQMYEEMNDREKYQNYMKEQPVNQKPEEDQEYLKKVKQYEEIVQGDDETNQDKYPSYERQINSNSINNITNYHQKSKQSDFVSGPTPGKIDKSNYIQGNPCKFILLFF